MIKETFKPRNRVAVGIFDHKQGPAAASVIAINHGAVAVRHFRTVDGPPTGELYIQQIAGSSIGTVAQPIQFLRLF